MSRYADRFTALLDACVLGGALRRNMLLSLAEAGLFRPRWSSRILDETQKAITQITKGETDGSRQRAAIEAAFPEALVTGYEIFEGKLALPDPNDNHVLAAAIDAASPEGDPRPRLVMTPRGKPLTQERVRELSAGPGVVVLCGRFEGIDERVIAARGLEEVSIGDFVLSGGEIGALVLLDACVRLLPGVMGAEHSGHDESFETGLLEYPQYTRPQVFEGAEIPAVLTSGDHGAVEKWRRARALEDTAKRRPDLLDSDDAGNDAD